LTVRSDTVKIKKWKTDPVELLDQPDGKVVATKPAAELPLEAVRTGQGWLKVAVGGKDYYVEASQARTDLKLSGKPSARTSAAPRATPPRAGSVTRAASREDDPGGDILLDERVRRCRRVGVRHGDRRRRRGEFSFGAMAIGQAKDVDYARAEGLGLVPTSPLDAYLNGVLAKLLAQSPVKGVPAKVYVRASGDWAAKSTADANIYVALGTLLRLDNEDESRGVAGARGVAHHSRPRQRRRRPGHPAARDPAQRAGRAPRRPPAATRSDTGVEEQSRILILNTKLLSPAGRATRSATPTGSAPTSDQAGYSPQAMASLLRKQKTFETERAADPQESTINQLFGLDTTQRVQEETVKATKDMGGGDALGSLAVPRSARRWSGARRK
jgi:hypothetical protein